MFLLDSNITSEMIKKHINAGTRQWLDQTDFSCMYVSVITLIETEKGLLLLKRKDPKQANNLSKLYEQIILSVFKERVLPVDETAVSICASLHIPNPRPAFDSLIAATALVHDFTLVTRNVADFKNIEGLRIINPFS